MALVAYGNSDSESEGNLSDVEEDAGGSVVLLTTDKKINNGNTLDNPQKLFTKLPEPKHDDNGLVEEIVDEFLSKKEIATECPKKVKQVIKIGIPSLAQFDSDDDEPLEKKQKVSQKSSGLFAILPPPKGSVVTAKSFIPNVVAKRAQSKPKKVLLSTNEIRAKQATVLERPQQEHIQDESEDEDVIEPFDDEEWKKICGRKKKVSRPIIDVNAVDVFPVVDAAPSAPEPYSGLDNEAFKKLVGSGGVKNNNIKLIDVNEEEVMPDKDVWMTKALTDPECKPKYVVDDPVNDTCKKKHHITYLAQQAKANEQELQNQWSQNKYSRKQTQAKYGF